MATILLTDNAAAATTKLELAMEVVRLIEGRLGERALNEGGDVLLLAFQALVPPEFRSAFLNWLR